MTPRFIINQVNERVQTLLGTLGYSLLEGQTIPVNGSIKVTWPYYSVLSNVEDNEAIPVIQGNDVVSIKLMAESIQNWNSNSINKAITIGTENLNVKVYPAGLLIDSVLIPMKAVIETLNGIKNFAKPIVLGYGFSLDRTSRFMTIGCAQYSIEDLEVIVEAHQQLFQQPAS